MNRVTGSSLLALHGRAATQVIERKFGAQLPPHALMQRAGLAVARLALALAPHAKTIWIACGPGNNGGDGAHAAIHLAAWGKQIVLTGVGDLSKAPPDALDAWQRAAAAGLSPLAFSDAVPALGPSDLCIDALLGVGASRSPQGSLAQCIERLNAGPAPVLAIDLPSGLNADTGTAVGTGASHSADLHNTVRADWTLSLLTLKPGLFTGQGRDFSGGVWFDDLGADNNAAAAADAMLGGAPTALHRLHASHKGSYGDVVVVGGAPGMLGAALLAATAALHGGAGRVLLSPLQSLDSSVLAPFPELMLRDLGALDLGGATLVCGCGGSDAVAAALPRVISSARALVLDADALNAIANDSALQTLLIQRTKRAERQDCTVLTPHPLEAARLLGSTVAAVQADRLLAARELAQRYRCTVALKGSGTVLANATQMPVINPTGNARLATAGTGDVLAGMIGARLAGGYGAFEAACAAVYEHGQLADAWPASLALTAGALAKAVGAHPARR